MGDKMVKRSVPANAMPHEQLASLRKLEKRIGYRYRDVHMLQKALIHRSYVNESEVKGLEDNERLEFVGDAVLQFVVSEYLYQNNPEEPEGSLTVMRSSIVARKRCAAMARKLGLADFVLVGKGERRVAGGLKSSILANTFEALVASLYFDGGMEEARRFILKMITEYLPSGASADENFKARLQAISQKSGGLLPSYRLLSSRGPEHQKTFEVEVSIKGVPYGRGKGASKKEAEQQAARKALEKLPDAGAE